MRQALCQLKVFLRKEYVHALATCSHARAMHWGPLCLHEDHGIIRATVLMMAQPEALWPLLSLWLQFRELVWECRRCRSDVLAVRAFRLSMCMYVASKVELRLRSVVCYLEFAQLSEDWKG